jgi:hypothetical protein
MLRALSRKARLFALGVLVGLVVQTGTLRSVDTVRRLQWTRSLWTSAPEMSKPQPDFGAVDDSGRMHAWWGIGQSLSFLPSDVLSVAVARAAGLSAEPGGRLQRAVVSATYYPMVTGLCVAAAYWWLIGIGMSESQSTFGALALLFATTLLYWTHGGQENSLMLLCALAAAGGAAHWIRTGRQAFAAIATIGLGYSFLIRPQAIVIAGLVTACCFAALADKWREVPRAAIRRAAPLAAMILTGVVIFERVVHYARFHEFWGTYIQHYRWFGVTLPPGWPLDLPFLDGFRGQTVSRFSVLYFEPLLLLPLLLPGRRRASPRSATVMLAGLAVTLLFNVVAYSKFDYWYGGASWGPRYITVPAEMLGALAVAMLAAAWPRLPAVRRFAAGGLVTAAAAIQFSSVLLDDSLEILQNVAGRPIVAQRFVNLWHFFWASDVSTLGWQLYPGGTPHITLFPWLGSVYLGSSYGAMALSAWLILMAATVWLTRAIVRTAVVR